MKNRTVGGICGLLLFLLPSAEAQLLTAEPGSLSFSYDLSTPLPARQTVKIDSSLFGVRLSPPEIKADGNWLSATLAFQSTPDNLFVGVNPLELPPGKYQGSITISSPSAPSVLTKTVPVDLTVGSIVSLQHQLGFSPAPPVCFAVDIAPGSPPVVSAGPPNWLVAAVDPASSRRICVSVNPAGLTPGAFTGRVTVPGSTGSTAITVNLNVTAAPAVNVSLNSLSFTQQLGAAGTPAPQTLSIVSERPAAGVKFTSAVATESGGGWLKAVSDGETTPARLTVSVDPTGLAPGNYRGAVTVTFSTALDEPVVVSVNLTVLGLNLSVAPASLTFAYEAGAPATSQTIAVAVKGAADESLPWTFHAAASEAWLLVTPPDGDTPGAITVSFNAANLAKGTYSGKITITSPQTSNTPQTVDVTLRIVDPTLRISRSRLDFTLQAGAALPAAKSVSISSSSAVLNFTAAVAIDSGGNWLVVTPASGLRTPQDLSIAPARADLPPGVYSATITITAPAAANSTFVIPVTLNVRARPMLQVRPTSMTFLQQVGAAPVAAQTLRISGALSDMHITGSLLYKGVNYLTVPATATTPADLAVSVDTSTLPSGTYNGSVIISSAAVTNSPITVPVVVNVKETPIISASPASLSFTYYIGGNKPEAQVLTVVGSSLAAFNSEPAVGTAWLSVTPPNGLTAVVSGDTGDFTLTASRLNITVNAKGMPEGVYNSSVVIQPDETSAFDRVTIPVTLTVRKNLVTLPEIVDGNGWFTSVALLSTDLETSPFRLDFWAPDGRPLAPAGVGSVPSPGLQFLDTAGTAATTAPGWAELSGQKAMAGSAVLRQRLSSNADAEAALAFSGAPTPRFVVPFDNTLGYATGASIVNRGGAAAVLTVTIRNEDGRQTATDTVRVEARSQKTLLFPAQFAVTANRRGSIEFNSPTGEIYAAGFRNSPLGLSTAWNVPPPAATGFTPRLVPLVADGQGWTTTIILVNTGSDPAPVSLVFKDQSGGLQAPPIGGGDPGVEYFDVIPPGGTRFLRTDDSSPLRSSGWAEIVGSREVMAMASVHQPGDVEAEATVPSESAVSGHVYLPFDDTQGLTTSFGLLNPSIQDTGTAKLSFRDENGLALLTDSIDLQPGASRIVALPASYLGLFNRRGVVDVRLTGLEMFGLRNSQRSAFTFLPVLPR